MIKISNNVYILLNLHTIPFRVPDMYIYIYQTWGQIQKYLYLKVFKYIF